MEDYFSIDDILASEPRVYCTFRVRGHNLSHLDPMGVTSNTTNSPSPSPTSTPTSPSHNTTNHIPAGHRLAIPFWLADSLAERSIISVELPRAFATGARNALRADARITSLNAHCGYFFRLGMRLAALLADHSLPGVLSSAFATRCWHVADCAAYARVAGSKAVRELDEDEVSLFFTAHGSAVAVRRWKERKGDKIDPVQSALGKRKEREDTEVGSPVTPQGTRVRVS